ncbi:MAG: PilZ domain-containing protein [Terriglobia bacterium]
MNERRISPRIPMGLPVELRWKTRAGTLKQATGKIGNISGSGLFIEVPIRLNRATSLMVKVVLPRGVSQDPLELSCRGRVVRWMQDGQVEGLCVVIDEYELHPMSRAGSGDKRPRKQPIRTPGRPEVSHK